MCLRTEVLRQCSLKQSIHKASKSIKHVQPPHGVGISPISLLVFTCPLSLANLQLRSSEQNCVLILALMKTVLDFKPAILLKSNFQLGAGY